MRREVAGEQPGGAVQVLVAQVRADVVAMGQHRQLDRDLHDRGDQQQHGQRAAGRGQRRVQLGRALRRRRDAVTATSSGAPPPMAPVSSEQRTAAGEPPPRRRVAA